ncbi:hypothetical protein [Larkinella terrae]|uniref:Tetratricopeptide repeat protein n=1 Tax=Larkinella terrae TaxID=2025311 RepID=A0A7K0EMA2_9BACT|nr:hypothetical protein [Larkinella terrae]MRS62967.1 hypothetical protein [Larkinella terrae]
MRLTEDQYELIEAYLKNELSATDRSTFEADIQADAQLRTEIERQRNLRLGLRAIGITHALDQARIQYKTSLLAAKSSPKRSTIFQSFPAWTYWAAAASIAVVVGFGYLVYQGNASWQADLAYYETFRSDANADLLKGFPAENVSSETKVTFLDAFKNYKAGNYDAVIERLKNLPLDKQTVHYKDFLLGLSYLSNDQPVEAVPLLTKAQQTPSPELRQKAVWFLALAYVKMNEKEQAIPILKQISADKMNPFQSLAQKVLRKIQ